MDLLLPVAIYLLLLCNVKPTTASFALLLLLYAVTTMGIEHASNLMLHGIVVPLELEDANVIFINLIHSSFSLLSSQSLN